VAQSQSSQLLLQSADICIGGALLVLDWSSSIAVFWSSRQWRISILVLPALAAWAAKQHLISCGNGGWWQRIAYGITWALAMCYNDVCVKCKVEVKGLSEISAHRPGDLVNGLIDTPLELTQAGPRSTQLIRR